LNAGAALVASGRTDHLGEAVSLAVQSIDSGSAAAKLEALIRFTHRHAATP
jgi:anthranilate phosphoribosyltransferase